MNEADTRADLIDPKLVAAGWGVLPDTKILREHPITLGRIEGKNQRGKKLSADYVLVYKNRKLAVIEAKKSSLAVGEGVMQAKLYAQKLCLDFAYASNGHEIYEMALGIGQERTVAAFPTPDDLWQRNFAQENVWREKFNAIPFEIVNGKSVYYYQELAVTKTLDAIASGRTRILLTLATGAGKTFIAFQIAWKLFHTRWNLRGDGQRQPRILFLADRNNLADQAFNGFCGFAEDALKRIAPDEIRKTKGVPTNGSVFFTIFQTFMSGEEGKPYFGDYPPDFFDLIIIDECHRGGANDEGSWRGILEYFAPAVQLGLTATPKRTDNADTYRYFGEPVYTYALKDGINDGFLTPFKVRRIHTTLDDYRYTSDDEVLEGEVETGRLYEEKDFNRIIEIKAREEKRVKIFLSEINQSEKTLVFCATQEHAAMVRDLVNQFCDDKSPNYCVRVTANDGSLGQKFLETFQDNDNTIPTILTTSQKLSTGVDATNVRNIVLMRPVKSMIEFKQIIGRGTRLHDGKAYFTIYDFVSAYNRFSDPDWDGDLLEPEVCETCLQAPCICVHEAKLCSRCGQSPCACEAKEKAVCDVCGFDPCTCKKKVKIKLRDGKERTIQHMAATHFWAADGKPIPVEEFLQNLYGILPSLFQDEAELRRLWSNPNTRKALLERLNDAGYGKAQLSDLQRLVDADKSDLFDVLEYIAYDLPMITREERATRAKPKIVPGLTQQQQDFLEFVLFKYVESGFEELDQEKLSTLVALKYQSVFDGIEILGGNEASKTLFFTFQNELYAQSLN